MTYPLFWFEEVFLRQEIPRSSSAGDFAFKEIKRVT